MDYTNYYINKYNNSTLKTDFETTAQTKLNECYYYLKICKDIIINNELLSDEARSNDANSICGKLEKYCKMLDPNATGEDTIKGKIDKKVKKIKENAKKCDGWYQKYSGSSGETSTKEDQQTSTIDKIGSMAADALNPLATASQNAMNKTIEQERQMTGIPGQGIMTTYTKNLVSELGQNSNQNTSTEHVSFYTKRSVKINYFIDTSADCLIKEKKEITTQRYNSSISRGLLEIAKGPTPVGSPHTETTITTIPEMRN